MMGKTWGCIATQPQIPEGVKEKFQGGKDGRGDCNWRICTVINSAINSTSYARSVQILSSRRNSNMPWSYQPTAHPLHTTHGNFNLPWPPFAWLCRCLRNELFKHTISSPGPLKLKNPRQTYCIRQLSLPAPPFFLL